MDYIVLIKEAFVSQALITTIIGFISSFGNYSSLKTDLSELDASRKRCYKSKEESYTRDLRISYAMKIRATVKKIFISLALIIILQIGVCTVDLNEHNFAVTCMVLLGTFCIGRFIGRSIAFGLSISKYDEFFEGFTNYGDICSFADKQAEEAKKNNVKPESYKDTHYDEFKETVLKNKKDYMTLRGIKSDKELTLCDKYIIENVYEAKKLGFDVERPNASYIKVASILMEKKGKHALKKELRVLSKKSKKDF